MAITEDASTPVIATGTGSTSTLTTASFTPPGGSLLLLLVVGGWSNTASKPTVTISSSVPSLTWTPKATALGPSSDGGLATVVYCYLASAPGALTVTATYVSLGAGRWMAVRVLNGAAATQTGASATLVSATSTTGTTAGTLSLTTTTAGSQVYGAINNSRNSTPASPTLNGNTSLITGASNFWQDTGDSCEAVGIKGTSPTGTPGATVFGGTWNAAALTQMALMEILPGAASAPSGDFFPFMHHKPEPAEREVIYLPNGYRHRVPTERPALRAA